MRRSWSPARTKAASRWIIARRPDGRPVKYTGFQYPDPGVEGADEWHLRPILPPGPPREKQGNSPPGD